MRTALKKYLPAMVCAIVPLVCYLLVRPYAEIGMQDDWSFIKSAQVLAQTGHIVYNGWATAMLGWQLYWGALFIKLFGFSFTVVRFSTVIEAMATAFLLERTCERAGLNAWNATLATLTFVLSPIFFPYMFTFMTDVSGILCIVACLYMCLRAIQAESEGSAMVWISLAALVNAVDGTVRQIAWLGVVVLVPCTLLLLRKNRRVLVVGSISCVTGAGFVVAALYWFARQPYSVPQPPVINGSHLGSRLLLEHQGLWSIGVLATMALPMLLMFAGAIRSLHRRRVIIFAISFLCLFLAWFALNQAGKLQWWQVPFFDGSITVNAFERLNAIVVQNTGLAMAGNCLAVLIMVSLILGILGLVACFLPDTRTRPDSQQGAQPISWPNLGFILGCFCVGYVALLVISSYQYSIFMGRYLIPLLAIFLLVLGRCYQERVKARLPWACVLLVIAFGAFSATATHDEFALYRGYAAAIQEILSSGAPATQIAGPYEFEFWTQIEKAGYVNDSRIRLPQGAYVPQPQRDYPTNCDSMLWEFLNEAPVVEPVYAVSTREGECGGQDAFPPVTYRTWLAPHLHWVYAVKLPPGFSQ